MTKVRSYERVPYPVRPSKQVERKLFVEVFQRLADHGISVRDATYIGLGSVFYVDFLLFHKYLYVDHMVCSENSGDDNRMKFNLPYKFIDLRLSDVSALIPEIEEGRRYLIWLDFDQPLGRPMLDTIGGFVRRLSSGSIFIVTIDAQHRVDEEVMLEEDFTLQEYEDHVCHEMNRELGRYIGKCVVRSDLSQNELPRVLVRAIEGKVKEVFSRRSGMDFLRLFNFKYADGAQMLTYGGIVCNLSLRTELSKVDWTSWDGVETGREPRSLTVPPLTHKEKQWLDSHMKKKDRKVSRHMPFELKDSARDAYLRYYRHYPTYADSLL